MQPALAFALFCALAAALLGILIGALRRLRRAHRPGSDPARLEEWVEVAQQLARQRGDPERRDGSRPRPPP